MTRTVTVIVAGFLFGCSHRAAPSSTDGSSAVDDRADGAVAKTSSACTLPPGVHGTGDFDAAAPNVDTPTGTFTTDQSKIKLDIPIKTGVTVSLYASRPSTDPVLPHKLQLESLPKAQGWDVTLQHAWCNAMECRIDFHGSSYEPTDRLKGWVELKRPPDATQTLFSNLSLMVVCVTGLDNPGSSDFSAKKSLTVNVVAGRQQ